MTSSIPDMMLARGDGDWRKDTEEIRNLIGTCQRALNLAVSRQLYGTCP